MKFIQERVLKPYRGNLMKREDKFKAEERSLFEKRGTDVSGNAVFTLNTIRETIRQKALSAFNRLYPDSGSLRTDSCPAGLCGN